MIGLIYHNNKRPLNHISQIRMSVITKNIDGDLVEDIKTDTEMYTLVCCKKHGLYERRNNNGTLAYRCNYVDDKKHGLEEQWHTNGQMSERCIYIDDKKQGLSKKWSDRGKLTYSRTYYGGKEYIGISVSWHNMIGVTALGIIVYTLFK
jgi:antitoxin component YwqK of YwqJK toxin-antitoxin module